MEAAADLDRARTQPDRPCRGGPEYPGDVGHELTLGSLAALEVRRATFDEVREAVRDRFYDRDLRGLDWPAVRRRCQPLADAADTREQLAVVSMPCWLNSAPRTPAAYQQLL